MGENIQKPRPVVLGRGDANGVGSLHANDVHGVQPLVPGLHLELHRLPFGESLEPVHLDGRKMRSEEHTSELQSRQYLVCRLLLEKKKENTERYSETGTLTRVRIL